MKNYYQIILILMLPFINACTKQEPLPKQAPVVPFKAVGASSNTGDIFELRLNDKALIADNPQGTIISQNITAGPSTLKLLLKGKENNPLVVKQLNADDINKGYTYRFYYDGEKVYDDIKLDIPDKEKFAVRFVNKMTTFKDAIDIKIYEVYRGTSGFQFDEITLLKNVTSNQFSDLLQLDIKKPHGGTYYIEVYKAGTTEILIDKKKALKMPNADQNLLLILKENNGSFSIEDIAKLFANK